MNKKVLHIIFIIILLSGFFGKALANSFSLIDDSEKISLLDVEDEGEEKDSEEKKEQEEEFEQKIAQLSTEESIINHTHQQLYFSKSTILSSGYTNSLLDPPDLN